jgi:LPXTG-motif cell wall-anchored protein
MPSTAGEWAGMLTAGLGMAAAGSMMLRKRR